MTNYHSPSKSRITNMASMHKPTAMTIPPAIANMHRILPPRKYQENVK